MSRTKVLLLGGVVVGAFAARSMLPGTAEEPDYEPLPVSRVVDEVEVDLDWERTSDLRDPFAPLVLPSASPPVGDVPPGS